MAHEWKPSDIARLRLVAQRIHQPGRAGPLETVTDLTAMQGQDLPGVLWSIGLRTPDATEADVRAAFDRAELVRSWPMRGTLHVTTPDDVRMILPLSRNRLVTSFATRHRELGITAEDVGAR
ncbi:DNA glycosylase AlkZ-like family protein [Mycetocola miduiensis]|uniref:Winged helix DNA-binding domain-containing protein n=1 Tax=Mycetocola miduiensis TaxID=995034 RepID=A0A1I5CUB1_9MICO|nr:crosslink repair DNA glycosylase YcaQ family protein [Mycetocola miduiensis]SFN90569.1 Winged helix DNA-binding domain-containing protein [Mycetocola miduiensis]